MIRKFAFVAIATAAIAGSHIGTTNAANAANAAPPSFLGGSYGIARMGSPRRPSTWARPTVASGSPLTEDLRT